MIPKDLWIENITDSLKEIASAEFQEKGWVRNEIHDYCTFVETACRLFDDNDVAGFLDHAEEFGLSEEQIQKIYVVCVAFHKYETKHGCYQDPQSIVTDPKWLKIRQMAKDALISLGIEHYLDPSKDIFKKSLLRSVYWIADPEIFKQKSLQERPNSEKNPFEEFMDDIFRSSKFEEIIAQYKEYEITESQLTLLKSIRDKLKLYKENMPKSHNLIEVLEDPEWHQIQILAREAVNAFKFRP